MHDILCIYYSRSGNTRAAAEEIAAALDAELAEITDAQACFSLAANCSFVICCHLLFGEQWAQRRRRRRTPQRCYICAKYTPASYKSQLYKVEFHEIDRKIKIDLGKIYKARSAF